VTMNRREPLVRETAVQNLLQSCDAVSRPDICKQIAERILNADPSAMIVSVANGCECRGDGMVLSVDESKGAWTLSPEGVNLNWWLQLPDIGAYMRKYLK